MLFLLSPAKSLDYDTPVPESVPHTRPQFVPQSTALIEVLREKSVQEIASLMALSDTLAALNVARYQVWKPQFTASNSRQAVLAFNGDVYEGLQARSLSAEDLDWAQRHIAILSGLYGVLRPFDRLQPYRLEMGTRLATARGCDLYAYWGDTIAQHLNQRQQTLLTRNHQQLIHRIAGIVRGRMCLVIVAARQRAWTAPVIHHEHQK